MRLDAVNRWINHLLADPNRKFFAISALRDRNCFWREHGDAS
nr:MAG TPA: hypothetical protein [Caudoviricetes sp.]DAZ83264.1 MAG TPA: hypothetical protein [Caudoviricetes sp.]